MFKQEVIIIIGERLIVSVNRLVKVLVEFYYFE
jgi:hypothetical protein